MNLRNLTFLSTYFNTTFSTTVPQNVDKAAIFFGEIL